VAGPGPSLSEVAIPPRSRLSPSPGVGRGGVHRLPEPCGRPGQSSSSSKSWLSPSPGGGRGEVHLPRPRQGLNPGVGRGGASYVA
jgi:hypothetical protein